MKKLPIAQPGQEGNLSELITFLPGTIQLCRCVIHKLQTEYDDARIHILQTPPVPRLLQVSDGRDAPQLLEELSQKKSMLRPTPKALCSFYFLRLLWWWVKLTEMDGHNVRPNEHVSIIRQE